MENHEKLCDDLRGTVPPQGYEELLALPQFLQDLPKPETFEELLTRIKSKVTTQPTEITLPEDVDNVEMNNFMERMVNKVWKKPNASQTSQNSQNKRTVAEVETSTAEVADNVVAEVPPKRPRGRPRKNPAN